MDWKEFIVQIHGIYIPLGPLNPWKNPGFFAINTLVHGSKIQPWSFDIREGCPIFVEPGLGAIFAGKGVVRINAMGLPRSLHV